MDSNPHPLAGWGGKPIVGSESEDTHFVGRIVLELFEGPHITSDANGLAFIINPGIGTDIDSEALVKRIADAFPAFVERVIKGEERKRTIARERGGMY